MSIGNSSIIEARLVMLPFAVVIWLAAWSVRLFPSPIKNPVVRASVQSLFVAVFLGAAVGEMTMYRLVSGIRVLENDPFFLVSFSVEYLVAICVTITSFSVASKRQAKAKNGRRP